MKKEEKLELQNLIADNELEKAIQILLKELKDEDRLKDVLHLSARLNAIRKQEHQGLLSYEKIALELNKITSSFLYILDKIKFEDKSVGNNQLDERTNSIDGKRLALVMGCKDYENGGGLNNPLNDVHGMAKKLKELGFEVMVRKNPNLSTMEIAIDDFGTKLEEYEVGLFYFAGHGIQVKGLNYLVPVDANLENEDDVKGACLAANTVLANMENATSQVNIIILDACRNNPFERSWGRGIEGRGLAVMNAPQGSIIAYSTAPGKTASDGMGENGLYTGVLIDELGKDDSSIIEMFQKVRKNVMNISRGTQIPWEATSLVENFYMCK